jgi:hypothetical protein
MAKRRLRALPAVGNRIGKWIVLRPADPDRNGVARWWCRCDCGREAEVYQQGLVERRSRQCQSCANRRHGMSKSPEYTVWQAMRGRCQDPIDPSYERYGGRGIKVCERWQTFENFLVDMGKRPSLQHTLDRRDNNGDYEPSNCRWATAREQQLNRRDSRYLTLGGERLHITDWAKRLGVSLPTLWSRNHMGWSDEEILSRPVRVYKRAA